MLDCGAFQMADGVRSCVVLSENVPMREYWRATATGSSALPGVTATPVSVAAEMASGMDAVWPA